MTRQTADYDARARLQTYEQEQRDLNRADGSGGLFVPPAWLVNEYVGLPGRPGLADLLTAARACGHDQINVPKILTVRRPPRSRRTTTGAGSRPHRHDHLRAVRTIAGQQDVALQLLDQSR
jgi:hypothetical protein